MGNIIWRGKKKKQILCSLTPSGDGKSLINSLVCPGEPSIRCRKTNTLCPFLGVLVLASSTLPRRPGTCLPSHTIPLFIHLPSASCLSIPSSLYVRSITDELPAHLTPHSLGRLGPSSARGSPAPTTQRCLLLGFLPRCL